MATWKGAGKGPGESKAAGTASGVTGPGGRVTGTGGTGVLPVKAKPSKLLDTRVAYCGDCLEQLRNLPDKCIDMIYIDPPFNANRNYEVFWRETKEKLAGVVP